MTADTMLQQCQTASCPRPPSHCCEGKTLFASYNGCKDVQFAPLSSCTCHHASFSSSHTPRHHQYRCHYSKIHKHLRTASILFILMPPTTGKLLGNINANLGFIYPHFSELGYPVYPVLCRVAMVTARITASKSPNFNVRVKELHLTASDGSLLVTGALRGRNRVLLRAICGWVMTRLNSGLIPHYQTPAFWLWRCKHGGQTDGCQRWTKSENWDEGWWRGWRMGGGGCLGRWWRTGWKIWPE